ncbi:MAG TPA: hypothetical protein VMT35_14445 [Ignavibacteriaceae bacterium]|nr:hypothetical protein [Ignavibacteriaceae bacterium]
MIFIIKSKWYVFSLITSNLFLFILKSAECEVNLKHLNKPQQADKPATFFADSGSTENNPALKLPDNHANKSSSGTKIYSSSFIITHLNNKYSKEHSRINIGFTFRAPPISQY